MAKEQNKHYKNWFRRHPVWSVILGFILFFSVIVAITPNDTASYQQKEIIEKSNQNQEQVQECTSIWVCGNWSECKNNIQIRTCRDTNYCSKSDGKPIEQKSCVEEKKVEMPSKLTELSKALKDLEKGLEKQSSINKKINQCTELCAGGDIDIPVIKNTCHSDCYQVYYYGGEGALDDLIKSYGG